MFIRKPSPASFKGIVQNYTESGWVGTLRVLKVGRLGKNVRIPCKFHVRVACKLRSTCTFHVNLIRPHYKPFTNFLTVLILNKSSWNSYISKNYSKSIQKMLRKLEHLFPLQFNHVYSLFFIGLWETHDSHRTCCLRVRIYL